MKITEVSETSLDEIDQTFVADCNGQIGNGVKVSLTGAIYLHVAEIRVFGRSSIYL